MTLKNSHAIRNLVKSEKRIHAFFFLLENKKLNYPCYFGVRSNMNESRDCGSK